MAFIEHGTRRLHITGVTAHPTAQWAVQQARNIAAALSERGAGPRFLLRDRDSKYTDAFDAVFTAEDTEVLLSTPRAPRRNAHCERVIGTIRREALDHVLILGENHARKVLTDYQEHYTDTGRTIPGNSYRPTRLSSPQSCTTSTTEARSAPGLSEASSTSIDTPRDLQRRLFEPHTTWTPLSPASAV